MNAKIIWSTGESYEQSSRFQKNTAVKTNDETFVVSSTPQIPMQPMNKPRETLNFQSASRDMFSQRGMNPFLNTSSTYSDHIAVQNTHLQPIDTSMTDRSISKT